MQITDLLAQMGGPQAIARDLGISEDEASTGAAALAPAILGGLKKQSQSSGLDGLSGLLQQLGGGGLLDNVLSAQPTDVGRGNDVLGQIFGSKEVSRGVAENAAAQTGLDSGVLKKMLPLVAMLVAGYAAKQGGGAAPQAGGLGGMLGGLLGGGSAGGSAGGLAAMLDANGDGNPIDDILGMLGKR